LPADLSGAERCAHGKLSSASRLIVVTSSVV